ncbi:NUDIX domain-containing protein [Pontibacter sp. BT310]|uniref:NUDIX domain-containing protein n=1 Tax=Pontibacter populi TaxID=890055 RepID=A0ABS6XCZ3_9BACT|nr:MULTISPECIES: NUDIX domain-containing protein [Pontibacter]MBJ6119011.1 NUDIX domain-containing protein [Pontibacter sp. BT310]MBR0571439.1 NUDIX domain-containing protein [Microvirga sp. STS03]MBW3365865.1 NUDIX domain-containing protein [Pontibacter populi]
MKVIDKLAWLEIQDGKILSTRSKGRIKYYIPGGKREAGESDQEALTREIREELSVELLEDTIKFAGVFQAQADSHAEGIEVKMTCYTGGFKGTISPSAEIEEVVWLTYKDRELISPVDKLIFDWLKETNMIN